MRIDKISLQGSNPWNEDALVVNESLQLYGVLDGATSLLPYRGAGGETGGYLASRLAADYWNGLPPAEAVPGGFSLREAVLAANARLRARMDECGIDVTRKDQLWSTGLVLVRILPGGIEYAQAGDCMLAAVYADGSVRVVTRDHVEHLDRVSKAKWREGLARGLASKAELWEYVRPVITANRMKVNTPEGYSVMNGEPELAETLEYGRINRIGLTALLLVTDGLFPPAAEGRSPGVSRSWWPGCRSRGSRATPGRSWSWRRRTRNAGRT
ncbi:protein phosphatase 2C domain-containing protein [Paenibacillus sp. CC-CFT747]|nr:protein phosphatase 2C domain-containing protein [Paenibacillus sp. CC-CFT747]